MRRQNNKLPHNLPQLQNLVKRDPASYEDEFKQQYRHFNNCLEVFAFNPTEENKSLDELVKFVAQVAHCYTDVCARFPHQLVNLLKNHASTLHPTMRNCFLKALIMMRNKNIISAFDLLELFFQLLRCRDKQLATFLQTHIITDIKNMNNKRKDVQLNSTLQNFMYTMLKDADPKAAKMSVDIMIELYNKNIWNDEKTVNAIATVGCFSKITKVAIASLKFFLGHDSSEDKASDSESEVDLQAALLQNRVNKKTRKRQKQLKQIKSKVIKAQKQKKNAPAFNVSSIHLLHNPQGLAEGLFNQLQASNDRYEVKLLYLDVISRLIGTHELFLFNFYSYIVRFIKPHQRQVTRILQFAAQASHEMVPNDIIEPILKAVSQNFITDRNSSDVMAIGLNAIREVCVRCPLAMSSDLLRDLVMYKTYKEKSVMMAARSLITLYREQLPALLHKKDRGRLTQAQAERKVPQYGVKVIHETIPGVEALLDPADPMEVVTEKNSDSDDEWSDVESNGNADFEISDGNESDQETDDESKSVSESLKNQTTPDDAEMKEAASRESEPSKNEKALSAKTTELEKKAAAEELALNCIFTDKDFQRMNAANLKKIVTNAHKKPVESERSEFVKLDNIEMIYKKRNHDKDSRLSSVKAGQQDREKYGWKDGRKNKNCSKTNREKGKHKNVVMMRYKARVKVKKSMRDKQVALRNHLLKQKRMK